MHDYKIQFENWKDHRILLRNYQLAESSKSLISYMPLKSHASHIKNIKLVMEKTRKIQLEQFQSLRLALSSDLKEKKLEHIQSFKEFLNQKLCEQNPELSESFMLIKRFFDTLIECDKFMNLKISKIIIEIFYAESFLHNKNNEIQILQYISNHDFLKKIFIEEGDIQINRYFFRSHFLNDKAENYLPTQSVSKDLSFINDLKELIYFENFPKDPLLFSDTIEMLTTLDLTHLLNKYLDFFKKEFVDINLIHGMNDNLKPCYWWSIYDTCTTYKLDLFAENLLKFAVLWILSNHENQQNNEVLNFFKQINNHIDKHQKTKVFELCRHWFHFPSSYIDISLPIVFKLLPSKTMWDLSNFYIPYLMIQNLCSTIVSCRVSLCPNIFLTMKSDDSLQEIIIDNPRVSTYVKEEFITLFQQATHLKSFIWMEMNIRDFLILRDIDYTVSLNQLEVLILDLEDYLKLNDNYLYDFLKTKPNLKTLFLGKMLPESDLNKFLNIIADCCPKLENLAVREILSSDQRDCTEVFTNKFLSLKNLYPLIQGVRSTIEVRNDYNKFKEENFLL